MNSPTMHDDIIKEALLALEQLDPDSTKVHAMVQKFGEAIDGQNTIVAVCALTATLTAAIELPHAPREIRDLTSQAQQQINWHYHLAIASVMKAATAAGVFDEFAAMAEKAIMDEMGIETDN